MTLNRRTLLAATCALALAPSVHAQAYPDRPVKLIFTYLHETWSEVPKIPTLFSLAVIGVILTVSTIASLIKSKKDPTAHAHAGRVTGAKKRE